VVATPVASTDADLDQVRPGLQQQGLQQDREQGGDQQAGPAGDQPPQGDPGAAVADRVERRLGVAVLGLPHFQLGDAFGQVGRDAGERQPVALAPGHAHGRPPAAAEAPEPATEHAHAATSVPAGASEEEEEEEARTRA
jgi:hypothetical protein